MRKFTLAAVVCLAAAAYAVPSAAAQSAGGCQLQGNASFSPGLGASSQPFSYGFTGNLTGCQSTVSAAPTSGTVSAGQTVAEQVHNSVTGVTDTVNYQEPVPTGSGGCASSTTSGQSLVTWADGTTTVLSYATTGAAAAVDLSGHPTACSTSTGVTTAAIGGGVSLTGQ